MNIMTPDHKLWPIFIRRLRSELHKRPQDLIIAKISDFLTIENCYVRGETKTISQSEYISSVILANKTKINCVMRQDFARSLKVLYEMERDYNIAFDINKSAMFFRDHGAVADMFIIKNVEKRYKKSIRRKIIFMMSQGVGDAVAFTAAIRDLKLAHNYLDITILTSHPDVFLNNPYAKITTFISNMADDDTECYIVDFRAPFWDYLQFGYPHFLGSFHKSIMYDTGLTYNPSSLIPDLHVTDQEVKLIRQKFKLKKPYWVINSGYRAPSEGIDGTMKWWGVRNYQDVVNQLKNQMNFVQVGTTKDVHTKLENVTSLIGKTTLRELICIIYDSNGTIGAISGHMHIAAAFNKPSVVIGGGFEDFMLTKYPKQRNIHSIGLLPCCRYSGCWSGNESVTCDNKVDGVCKCLAIIKPSQVINDLEHIFNMDKQ